MNQTGIIIGGGIGGLVTALCLNQRGIQASVYEKASILQEVGAGLILAPNALFVLDQLGLSDALQSISWPLQRGLIAEANGRVVQELNFQALKKRYGYETRVVHRGKLQRLLLDSLHPGQLHVSSQLMEIVDDDQQVSARFTDGSTTSGTFLIGADGIRSTVRTRLFGNQTLRYAGQSCWRTILTYPLPMANQTTSVEYWGRAAGLRIGIVPSGPNELYVYITVKTPPDEQEVAGHVMTRLRAISRVFTPVVSQVIDAMDESRLHRADLYDLPTLRTWVHGRCALLGDAAHATTPNVGQGACQAIEDAFTMAACLAQTTATDVAFQQYESIRKAKADRVVQLSRQIGQAVNLPGWLKPLAFTLMRAMPKSIGERQFDDIYNMDYIQNVITTDFHSRSASAE